MAVAVGSGIKTRFLFKVNHLGSISVSREEAFILSLIDVEGVGEVGQGLSETKLCFRLCSWHLIRDSAIVDF